MSSRDSILVVSPYRAEYGPARVFEHVLVALAAEGYRPVCAVPPGARLTEHVHELAPEIHVLAGLTTFPRTLNVIRLVRFVFQHLAVAHEIQELARAVEARAVYTVSEAIFAAPLAARRAGIPSIVHAIGMSIGRPRWGAHVYIRFLSRLADVVIACSSAVAEMFTDHGVPDEHVVVIHNGIDVDALEGRERAAEPPIGYEGPRVAMFAAYDPRKGHELFVEAAAIVARRRPDARFYVVGGALPEHPESIEFEERISRLVAKLGLTDRVERPGYVPAAEVLDWMRAMDVVVVPSRTEAFAHALLEAMLCGRAIVASGIEGNLDAFVHGHSGVYVERRPEELAAAVTALLDDPEAARRMGEAARERVLCFFGLGTTLPAIAHTVRQVLDRPSAA